MVLWDEIFAEAANDYPDVTTDTKLVDAVTTRMVLKPKTLDVLVATNLHADILSDLAAARLIAAIEDVTSVGEAMTPDLGGTATTEQVGGRGL